MVCTTTLVKALGLALTLQPVLAAIGVDVAQFSDETCGAANSITPVMSIHNGDCTKINTAPGKSVTVSTTSAGDFFCTSDQQMTLMIWRDSDSCAGAHPDASIGPLAINPTQGACIVGQVRSAKLACVGGVDSPYTTIQWKGRPNPVRFRA